MDTLCTSRLEAYRLKLLDDGKKDQADVVSHCLSICENADNSRRHGDKKPKHCPFISCPDPKQVT